MEKEGYRETLAFLSGMFPGKACLTVKEVAVVMGSAEHTVYDAVKRVRNPLPAKKLKGKIVIPIPALARWMC